MKLMRSSAVLYEFGSASLLLGEANRAHRISSAVSEARRVVVFSWGYTVSEALGACKNQMVIKRAKY